MPNVQLELVAGNLQTVLGLLYNRLNKAAKPYSRQIIKDNYPDGINRVVTQINQLYPPSFSQDGRTLTAQSEYRILIEPGIENQNAGELRQKINYDDAIAFTAWQGQTLLLEVEYIETWQDLVNELLDEVKSLFGENQQFEAIRAQPAPVDAGQAGAAAWPEKAKRGAQLETEESLKKLRLIRFESIKNNRPIPTRAAAMDEAGITDKTWKKYAPDLWAKWFETDYRAE